MIRGRRTICTVVALTLASAAGMFGMVLTNPGPASASQPQLNSTGSSFAGVAISQWQGQFNELYGGGINFTVSNSVNGMNSFCNRTVDFGATDISYATQQATCTTNQVPYPFQYMPDVAGGLSFEYNLTGQNGQQVTNLVLNASALVGIFTGDINNWDNPAIAALNPSIRLPNQQITAYYRSDPCGENYLLGDYFLHTDPAPFTAFQTVAQVTPVGSPSATWASFGGGVPPGKESLVGVNGSDAASQGPVHQPGGITFVETAYAKNVGLPVASVVNQAGVPTQPSAYNVAVALTGAILYSDLTQNLGGVYTNPNPNTYPISAYSYFIAQCVPSAAAQQNFAVRQRRERDDGHGTGSRTVAIHRVRGLPRPVPDGRSRLFADSTQPGRRRLPGCRPITGGHRTARADTTELSEPLHHGSAHVTGRPARRGWGQPRLGPRHRRECRHGGFLDIGGDGREPGERGLGTGSVGSRLLGLVHRGRQKGRRQEGCGEPAQ